MTERNNKEALTHILCDNSISAGLLKETIEVFKTISNEEYLEYYFSTLPNTKKAIQHYALHLQIFADYIADLAEELCTQNSEAFRIATKAED